MSEEKEIEKFRNILRSKPTWGALAGSEMEEILTTYIGQRGAAYKLEAQRMAQEMFINLAFNRESIMARAEDEGYIPNMPQPFENEITVQNLGNAAVHVADKQAFISDEMVQMVVNHPDNLILEPGASETVKAQQLSKELINQTAVGNDFEEFILGGMDDDDIFTIHNFSVNFTIDGITETWENRQNFRNTDGTSEVYHTFYKMSDELAIRTGNDSTGRNPGPDAVMTATLWHTKGERAFLVKGIELKPFIQNEQQILDINGDIADLRITTGDVIAQGRPQESIESVRKHVLSHIQTGPVVARNRDYEFMLKKAFPELVYLKVWGEKEMVEKNGYNLDYMNKSFFSFLIEDETQTTAKTAEIIAYYDETIKPMNVIPEHVALTKNTFQVEIQGKIDRKFIVSDVQNTLTDLLMDAFGLYKNTSGRIKTSDIYQQIIGTEFFADALSHLNRKFKPYFTVNLTGTVETGFLNDYIYLDSVSFGDDGGGTTLGYVSTSG